MSSYKSDAQDRKHGLWGIAVIGGILVSVLNRVLLKAMGLFGNWIHCREGREWFLSACGVVTRFG